jgi:FkbM family methyltransferase
LKALLQSILKKCGLRVFRRATMSRGIDLTVDLGRLFGGRFPGLTLFDVGANVGQTALKLLEDFPGARIYAFEPVASTYEALVRNTQRHKSIETCRAALGASDGTALIRRQSDSTWNRIVRFGPDGSNDDDVEAVPMKRLDTFCNERRVSHIHLLKTDCEGYDLEAVKGAEALLKTHSIDSIYCEVNFLRNGKHTDFFELEAYLSDLGFVFYGLYEYSGWQYDVSQFGFTNALFVNAELVKACSAPLDVAANNCGQLPAHH